MPLVKAIILSLSKVVMDAHIKRCEFGMGDVAQHIRYTLVHMLFSSTFVQFSTPVDSEL